MFPLSKILYLQYYSKSTFLSDAVKKIQPVSIILNLETATQNFNT